MVGRFARSTPAPFFSRILPAVATLAFVACAAPESDTAAAGDQQVSMAQVERGRALVLEHACAACHGGVFTPEGDTYLVGMTPARPDVEFFIGACAVQAGAQPCFRTRPRNLTPDNLTGLGRFSERQIFNALRFGLRPGETPDVEITSSTPGQGNFPENPKFLAPPMPWPAWRHMPDDDLWAIAAYLKHGLEPVNNKVEDSEGPPDFWVGAMAEFSAHNPYPALPFPTANEVEPADASLRERVLRGRHVVIEHDCGVCHGGETNPANDGWLQGANSPEKAFAATPPGVHVPQGPCPAAGTDPCWMMRPKNLTPHETNGTGRYSERQIFNALRFGLRPSTTPDVEITSNIPGQGNFPAEPDFLGVGMPWPAWRYMSDSDLMAVAAYLKYGVKPVSSEVPDSDAPPDKWRTVYTVENIGSYPPPPFPAKGEIRR